MNRERERERERERGAQPMSQVTIFGNDTAAERDMHSLTHT